MLSFRRTLTFGVVFFFGQAAGALGGTPELVPAKTFVEVLNGQEVTSLVNTYRVSTARVVIADYGLLKRDFPQLASFTNAQIDAWILEQSGYLSKGQIDTGVKANTNTPIAHDPNQKKMALRPPQYDRALVFEAQGGGLIDGKGFGANVPANASHKNGLIETNQAVREFLYTKATKEIFQGAQAPFGVVDSYAVIDWGFDVRMDYGGGMANYRAGAVLRQAHVRDLSSPITAQGQLSREKMAEVERILRPRGMTSAQSRSLNGVTIETLNVQGTKDARYIYDFGAFRVQDRFVHPVYTIQDYSIEYDALRKNPEKFIVFDPKKADFPQVDAKGKLSLADWTGSTTRAEEEVRQRILRITEKLDHGKSLEEVRRELGGLVEEYVSATRRVMKVPLARFPASIQYDGCEALLQSLFTLRVN